MEQILNLLGFTNTAGILWSLLAYLGMILIITAVVFPKWRNQFFVWGPLILLLYAWFYLHDPILTGLQFIITTSGILNFLNIKKPAALIVIILAVVVFITLLANGNLVGLWSWLGALGLLGIALGLTQLPAKQGFLIMALGGLLIVIYALALQIWVFFILNAIFFAANILEWRRITVSSKTSLKESG